MPIIPKARRIVAPHRIVMMHFRAGDGSSDPARIETDRGDGCFFGGSTVPLALERLVSLSLVEAGGMSAFVEPSFFFDFLLLFMSRISSMRTAIATGILSRLVAVVASRGSAARDTNSPRSRESKGSDSKDWREIDTTEFCGLPR